VAVLQKQILNWIKFKSGGKVVFAPYDYVVRQNHVQYRLKNQAQNQKRIKNQAQNRKRIKNRSEF
jgi:hypothetical protein